MLLHFMAEVLKDDDLVPVHRFPQVRYSVRAFTLMAFFCFAMADFLTGCAAYRIPSIVPPAASVLSRTRQLTVGIERANDLVSDQNRYACAFASQQALIDALRKRDAFKRVDFLDRYSTTRPDIILKDVYIGTFDYLNEPYLLVATAGIIPQPSLQPYLLEFKIVNRGGTLVKSVNLREDYSSLEGWVAIPLRFFPGWSGEPASKQIVVARFACDVEKAVSEVAKAK